MSKQQRGSIEVITGPMFAGKSTELLRRLGCDVAIKRTVLCINHILDSRADFISTHNPLLSQKPNFEIRKLESLPNPCELEKFDTIGIDEAHFFSDLEKVVEYADNFNKKIIVAGLVGTSDRKKFGQIRKLLPHAEKFELLTTALCPKCAKETSLSVSASFSKKNSTPTASEIDIGGADKYQAVCRYHHLK